MVTRWFGGTKLGVGGLVRAYGGAAGEALDAVQLHPWIVMTTVSLSHSYTYTDAIDRLVADFGGRFVERSFEAQVSSVIQLGSHDLTEFTLRVADVTSGAFQILD